MSALQYDMNDLERREKLRSKESLKRTKGKKKEGNISSTKYNFGKAVTDQLIHRIPEHYIFMSIQYKVAVSILYSTMCLILS